MHDPTPFCREYAFPASGRVGYISVAVDEAGGEGVRREGRISEADLKADLAAGATIEHVAVVEQEATGDYLVYLRLAGSTAFVRLDRRKYEAAKVYRDYRAVRQRLRAEDMASPYRGVICCYLEGDSALTGLGLPEH